MFFSRNKKQAVSNFVLKFLNNNCPDVLGLHDGPRVDSRVNLSVVVLIIPLENKKLEMTRAFYAVTKDFSATSISVMIDAPRAVDDVILAFCFEGEMQYARAKAKHLSPMGGGFHQLGFQLEEMVAPLDYQGLSNLSF
jgi:hypothetical protein